MKSCPIRAGQALNIVGMTDFLLRLWRVLTAARWQAVAPLDADFPLYLSRGSHGYRLRLGASRRQA